MIFPSFTLEQQLITQGYHSIAGIDEVGRGCLAGPVVAAAVILNPHAIPEGLNDSKALTASQRENIYGQLVEQCSWAIGFRSPAQIDSMNILQATFCAMHDAVKELSLTPDYILVDGGQIPPGLTQPVQAIVKGDQHVASIAAASILAKVTRDRWMRDYDKQYPLYGFAKHVGYGTAAHRRAIAQWGPCPLHRLSFSPLRKMQYDDKNMS
jgi:ribonuclease HII